jgi:hypothetical protein
MIKEKIVLISFLMVLLFFSCKESVPEEIIDNSQPFGEYQINSITYGNGRFIIVAHGGRIGHSTDGINWAAVGKSPFIRDKEIVGVAYGNGKFVAVSFRGVTACSDDGLNWVEIKNAPFETDWDSCAAGITFGNGVFVMSGNKGRLAYSSDGINWTVIQPSFAFDKCTYHNDPNDCDGYHNTYISTIEFINGHFIASADVSKMAISYDGINWTEVNNPSFGVVEIAYGNGIYVAVSSSMTAISIDLINWSNNLISNYSQTYCITYGSNKFVIGGSNGKTFVSSDAVNWTEVYSPVFENKYSIKAIAYHNGMFVLGGTHGKIGYILESGL